MTENERQGRKKIMQSKIKFLLTYRNFDDKELLGMILSKHMDVMYNDRGCISIKKWDELIEYLILWKKLETIKNKLPV